MSLAYDLAALYRRDLTRIIQQIEAFGNAPALWSTTPGMTNSAGNLVLHLAGNLREYIGRQLGGIAFERRRPAEFSTTGLDSSELIRRVAHVRDVVPPAIANLSDATLDAPFPENVFGTAMTTAQFVIHLSGHLNYHMGQIDTMRRALTTSGAISLAGLE